MRLFGISIYVIATLLIFIAIIIAGLFILRKTTQASIGNLQVFKGSVEVKRAGQVQTGKTGDEINVQDDLKIFPNSIVSIVLKDSSLIRLEQGSEVEVGEIGYQGQKLKNASFKLKIGRLWSRVAPLESGGSFEVETPTIVAAVRGTNFNTTYLQEFTSVYVDKRKVDVLLKEQTEKSKQVTKGLFLRMRNDQLKEDFLAGPEIPGPDFFDDWIRFNQEEDQKICRDNPQTPGCSEQEEVEPSPTPSDAAGSIMQFIRSVAPLSTFRPTSKASTEIRGTTTTYSPSPSNPAGINTPGSNTPQITPSPSKELKSLSVTHDPPNYQSGTIQFYATVTYSDNSFQNVTKLVKWSVQSPANGSIDGSGLYKMGKATVDVVTATYGEHSASHKIDEQSSSQQPAIYQIQ